MCSLIRRNARAFWLLIALGSLCLAGRGLFCRRALHGPGAARLDGVRPGHETRTGAASGAVSLRLRPIRCLVALDRFMAGTVRNGQYGPSAMRLVVARCEVLYTGRLTATLAEAVRLLVFKADGSVLVHDDAGAYKPLNRSRRGFARKKPRTGSAKAVRTLAASCGQRARPSLRRRRGD